MSEEEELGVVISWDPGAGDAAAAAAGIPPWEGRRSPLLPPLQPLPSPGRERLEGDLELDRAFLEALGGEP